MRSVLKNELQHGAPSTSLKHTQEKLTEANKDCFDYIEDAVSFTM